MFAFFFYVCNLRMSCAVAGGWLDLTLRFISNSWLSATTSFFFFLKLQFRNSHLIQLQHYLFFIFLFLSLCLVQNGPLEWLFSFVLDRWTYNRELIIISLFLQSIISLGVCLRAYVYVNGRSNSSRSLLHHQRAGVGMELLPCLLYSPMDVKLWCLKCVNNFLHVTVSVWELNTQKEKCTERFCELCTL